MSKRKRKSDGPFVMLPLRIVNAPAWRVTSHVARVLWIELRRKLANQGWNNGKIFLSDRDAAEAVSANKDTIVRAYAELEDYGFLHKTVGGFLGSDGRGIATHYRFTDLAHGTHPATHDYEKWDGAISRYTPKKPGPKKQNPVRMIRTPRPNHSDIRRGSNGGSVCPNHSDIEAAPKCPNHSDISRLPLPTSSGGAKKTSVQGSLTVRAPAQAGGAGSSPAPVAREPSERARLNWWDEQKWCQGTIRGVDFVHYDVMYDDERGGWRVWVVENRKRRKLGRAPDITAAKQLAQAHLDSLRVISEPERKAS